MQSTPCRDLFEEVRQLLLLGAQPGDEWGLGMPYPPQKNYEAQWHNGVLTHTNSADAPGALELLH